MKIYLLFRYVIAHLSSHGLAVEKRRLLATAQYDELLKALFGASLTVPNLAEESQVHYLDPQPKPGKYPRKSTLKACSLRVFFHRFMDVPTKNLPNTMIKIQLGDETSYYLFNVSKEWRLVQTGHAPDNQVLVDQDNKTIALALPGHGELEMIRRALVVVSECLDRAMYINALFEQVSIDCPEITQGPVPYLRESLRVGQAHDWTIRQLEKYTLTPDMVALHQGRTDAHNIGLKTA